MLFLSLFLFVAVENHSASASEDSLILRIEADIPDGPQLKASVPISCLEALLYTVAHEFKKEGQKPLFIVEELFNQIRESEGRHLVSIAGDQQKIQIWVEEAAGEAERDLNFIKLYMKPERDKDMEINICLPKGLVELAGYMACNLPKPLDVKEMIFNIQPIGNIQVEH